MKQFRGKLGHQNKSLSSDVLQLYYTGFIPICTTYFTPPDTVCILFKYDIIDS